MKNPSRIPLKTPSKTPVQARIKNMGTRLFLIWTLLALVSSAGCARPAPTREGLQTGLAGAGTASVEVSDLRCEYLRDPLGIDVRLPRLSWVMTPVVASARGQRQSAYRILVASRRELLERDEGDLWDSGKVDSDQSAQTVYGGKPLSNGMECYWKVCILDEKGAPSAWSKPARWTVGPLEATDWSAKWIGQEQVFEKKPGWPPPDNAVPDPWLRKTFDLPEAPRRAVLHVASIGYHEVHVNGKKAGDAVLEPCATNHRKRARYVTYEIAELLRPGKNALGLWLGVSWSIFPQYKTADKPQSPLVLAQLEIELASGKNLRIATDETWRTHPSPSRLLGVWDFMHFGGELYDAGKEIPGWCDPELDDSSWKPASVFSPKLSLSAQIVEPNRPVSKIEPRAIRILAAGECRVDMGANFAGWFEIHLRGRPGQRVDFQFSERADDAMTHNLRSVYIIGPEGKGTFRNRFNYMVGRWIQVKGLDYLPSLEEVRGYMVRTDYRRASDFECSNDLLNRIYRTTLWTFENLSLGGYVVDCPQRERMGYGGDAHATTPTGLANYHLGAFYTKWSQDWRDAQGEDGNLPYTAPTYWGGGGPAWSGFCIALPWEVYQRYGDVRILEENFDTMERWLNFLEKKSAKDMLVRWGGEWDFLGDWLWPGAEGVNGDTRETLFFNNCYWIYNLDTAARVANVLGKDDVAEKLRARAAKVREAAHREFFNPAENSYVNGFQAYLAMALYIGLPPAELRPSVWKRLEEEILVRRKGHIHAGITGGAFLFKALMEAHRDDLILEMATKEDYPGWGDMLRRDATTMWESWEGKLSLLHSSYLYVGAWFIEGLAGIGPDPEVPGLKSCVLRPGTLPRQTGSWVKARHESLYGTIRSEWKIEGGKLRFEASVPPNTTATAYLPTRDSRSLTEGGRPLAAAEGVGYLRDEGGCAVLRLQPGEYSFESDLGSGI